MIASSNAMFAVIALGCLVLNYYAFRGDAAAAGHGRQQMLKIAAVWAVIITALAFLFSRFGA